MSQAGDDSIFACGARKRVYASWHPRHLKRAHKKHTSSDVRMSCRSIYTNPIYIILISFICQFVGEKLDIVSLFLHFKYLITSYIIKQNKQ